MQGEKENGKDRRRKKREKVDWVCKKREGVASDIGEEKGPTLG